MVFDAKYDSFKGVLVYVRVLEGRALMGERMRLMQQSSRFEPVEVGAVTLAYTSDEKRHRVGLCRRRGVLGQCGRRRHGNGGKY